MHMPIPLVDLKAQYRPLKAEILHAVETVFDGMQLFLGENVQALEKEFAAYCGAPYGVGVSDGTAALHILLRAMGVQPGDEVITVPNSFIATAEAIVLAGARPVFVDIDPGTYLMQVNQVERAITPRTRFVIPVHLYGQTVDMDPLLELAAAYRLTVIEDACQAHGATYKGRRAGSLGHAAAFSFYYAKNLGAYGEGGFISTHDPDVWAHCRHIRDHGSERRYYHDELGFNGRLDEVQAAILRVKLPHLDEWNKRRREHADLYRRLLSHTPAGLPVERPENRHIYHQFAIFVQHRDELQAYLKERGILTGIHYPVPIHLQKAFESFGYHAGDFPVSEAASAHLLSLPMFAELSDEDIRTICGLISTFYLGTPTGVERGQMEETVHK